MIDYDYAAHVSGFTRFAAKLIKTNSIARRMCRAAFEAATDVADYTFIRCVYVLQVRRVMKSR